MIFKDFYTLTDREWKYVDGVVITYWNYDKGPTNAVILVRGFQSRPRHLFMSDEGLCLTLPNTN